MRIGVYTHPLRFNYGGILQAYALQRVLQDMGHDAVYIEWEQYNYRLAPFKLYLSRFLWKIFKSREVIIFLEVKRNIFYTKISNFAKKNIAILPIKDLHEEDVDVLIVGSDQIWRPSYIENIEDAYLDFAKDWDVRRIAYAASFGVDDWSEYSDEQTAVCRELAQKFDAISVREDSGVALCRNYLGVEAQHVLDPTMLVDIKHYIRHINSCKKRYLERMCLAYILDEANDKLAVLNSVVKYQGYNVLQWKNIYTPNIKNPTVEEWLKGFYDAEFVFTDSFHGCVFSIIFNKPFIAFGNEERGMARFNSLLKMFGLEELLITSIDDFTPQLVDKAILRFSDGSIQRRLNELRRESYEFLLNALKL
ncbi:MAG: polysaccharide pyruvyl transferase family protein [Paludibacteraceae bacterium]|nr:polysaccharide pyruvyl transferase family protein [Paludibacteraceae bacterium]